MSLSLITIFLFFGEADLGCVQFDNFGLGFGGGLVKLVIAGGGHILLFHVFVYERGHPHISRIHHLRCRLSLFGLLSFLLLFLFLNRERTHKKRLLLWNLVNNFEFFIFIRVYLVNHFLHYLCFEAVIAYVIAQIVLLQRGHDWRQRFVGGRGHSGR